MIAISGGNRQGWPTSNSWQECKERELDERKKKMVLFNHIKCNISNNVNQFLLSGMLV